MNTTRTTEPTIINTFIGRLAAAPTSSRHGENTVTRFTLIRNEYAGKDSVTDDIRVRNVALPFTAFNGQAVALTRHCCKGDQLIVFYRIENNHYTDKGGNECYGFNFIVDSWQFGAPGEEKRQRLAAESLEI